MISNINDDPFKQNLIRFFVQFARLSNMHLIAEGVEREQELATLIRLGVSHAQGYHLARPGRLDEARSSPRLHGTGLRGPGSF